MRPSFENLMFCLDSKLPRALKVKKAERGLCLSYRDSCPFYVEVSGEVTIGGAKILAKWANRGLGKVKREKDAFKFTTGKSLSLSSISVIKEPCEKGYVALFWKDVFIGIGRISKNRVENVLDVGEFLRRGF